MTLAEAMAKHAEMEAETLLHPIPLCILESIRTMGKSKRATVESIANRTCQSVVKVAAILRGEVPPGGVGPRLKRERWDEAED